jgi:hypothetical protein
VPEGRVLAAFYRSESRARLHRLALPESQIFNGKLGCKWRDGTRSVPGIIDREICGKSALTVRLDLGPSAAWAKRLF